MEHFQGHSFQPEVQMSQLISPVEAGRWNTGREIWIAEASGTPLKYWVSHGPHSTLPGQGNICLVAFCWGTEPGHGAQGNLLP